MDFLKNSISIGIKSLRVAGLLVFLTSCHTMSATHQTSIEQIQSTMEQSISNNKAMYARSNQRLPSDVNTALLPPLSHYVNPVKSAPLKFDVSANKIPAREFFMSLVAGTQLNMVVHPSINGTITLNLKNVTVRQAMDAVRDVYGYEYHTTSYGYEVLPPQLETQLFHINYLDIKRTGRSYIELNTGQVSSVGTITVGGTSNTGVTQTPGMPGTPGTNAVPGTISSIETRSEVQFWKDMEKAMINIIGTGDGRSVTINPQAGVMSIRAFPKELHNISRFVNSLQSSINRQVILEAKILEVQLNDVYDAGIDWAVLNNPAAVDASGNPVTNGAGIGQDGTRIFGDTDLKELSGIFAVRINGNFKALIKLLQTQGNVQVLSSPHISTVNNQKAVIKVGQDEFFVTGVSTSNTIIGTNTIPSQDVSLTPFFSGITLDVTPEISADDSIVLHIHPSVSRVKEQTKVVGLGTSSTGDPNNLTLPLAKSTIRESDNVVRAKNGQVIVIGGLMQNTMDEIIAETPWVGKVPFIGAFFRRTKQESVKSELVILLRPVIATNQNEVKSLEQENKQFQILKRPFHTGGLPRVFGNEGERVAN